MTYNVFGGTLNLNQSINQSIPLFSTLSSPWPRPLLKVFSDENGKWYRPKYIKGNDKRFDLLSMPVEDLVNVAEDDFILAFHACWHWYLTVVDRLHVALRSAARSIEQCHVQKINVTPRSTTTTTTK